MRWSAIVNPRAGGITPARLDRVREALARVTTDVTVTRAPGHATELARRACAADGLAVVGGDGTLHEVLQSIDRRRQAVAIVPTGRGNSLARDFGRVDPFGSVRAIAAGRQTTIDLMDVQVQRAEGATLHVWSGSTIAVGYAVDVLRVANATLRPLGRWSYAAAAAGTRPRAFALSLTVDGLDRPASELTGLVVGNARHIANFLAFPNGGCADGLLDVAELHASWPLQLRHNLAILARVPSIAPTQPYQASHVAVRLPAPSAMMIDGEIVEEVIAFSARVAGGALKCHHA